MIEVSRRNNPQFEEFLSEIEKVADIFVVFDGGKSFERVTEENVGLLPEDIFNYFCLSKAGDLWQKFTTIFRRAWGFGKTVAATARVKRCGDLRDRHYAEKIFQHYNVAKDC